MHLILLRFKSNPADRTQHLAAHKAWIHRGFADGVFLLVGSLRDQRGGAIVAHAITAELLAARVASDPFVAHQLVEPEMIEITPNRLDPRLDFLETALGGSGN